MKKITVELSEEELALTRMAIDQYIQYNNDELDFYVTLPADMNSEKDKLDRILRERNKKLKIIYHKLHGGVYLGDYVKYGRPSR